MLGTLSKTSPYLRCIAGRPWYLLSLKCTIEAEYKVVEHKLSNYDPSMLPKFDFRVRSQLMALVLKDTITPRKMIDMIPHVQAVAKQCDSELIAYAFRQLEQQIPTPAPETNAHEFRLRLLLNLLMEAIQKVQKQETTAKGGKQKRHHHLAWTYKATIIPTG